MSAEFTFSSPLEVNRFISTLTFTRLYLARSFRPLSRWIGLYQDIHYYMEFVDCYRPLPRYIGLYRCIGRKEKPKYPMVFVPSRGIQVYIYNSKTRKIRHLVFVPFRGAQVYIQLAITLNQVKSSFRPLARQIGLYLIQRKQPLSLLRQLPSPLEVNKFISHYMTILRRFPMQISVPSRGIQVYIRWIFYKYSCSVQVSVPSRGEQVYIARKRLFPSSYLGCFRPLSRYIGLYLNNTNMISELIELPFPFEVDGFISTFPRIDNAQSYSVTVPSRGRQVYIALKNAA